MFIGLIILRSDYKGSQRHLNGYLRYIKETGKYEIKKPCLFENIGVL